MSDTNSLATFYSLVGQEFPFFGVDNNTFKLGDTVYEAVEDESDGYRSMLEDVKVKDHEGLIFFGQPVATVRLVSDDGEFDGYRLVDVADGHVWLRFGTDAADDYYPMFTFEYAAKAPQETP